MRYALMFALVGALFIGMVGCSSNAKKSSSDMSAVDDCPMCPGVQTAKADGTCPKCGMKVKG
jgi:hypothetical protein